MNTFLNIHIECTDEGAESLKNRLIRNLLSKPLAERIYLRGQREQHLLRFFHHYHESQLKRISKHYDKKY